MVTKSMLQMSAKKLYRTKMAKIPKMLLQKPKKLRAKLPARSVPIYLFYLSGIAWLCAALIGIPLGTPFFPPLLADGRPDFKWPLLRGTFPDLKGLTSTFAESRTDHFHNGLDIAALNAPVHPVARGVILYSRHTSDDPFRPEEGPGNYIFVDHGHGWRSGYYHLKGDRPMQRSGPVTDSTILGYSGNSGHSAGAHLHFFMASTNGQVIHNPLELLPPATDQYAPVIGQLQIRTPKGRTLISHSRKEHIRLTRAYPFQITIIDPGLEKHSRRGIYELRWKINGSSWQMRRFSRLVFQNGKWLLDGKYGFEESFRYNTYNLGELDWKDGENTLLVRARDFSGNKSEALFTIDIKKEY